MFSATQIAQVINGTVIGEDHKVNTFAKIEEAPSNALTFLANLKYEPYIYTTEAGIIIVDEAFEPKTPISNTLIKVKNAYEAFAKLLQWYEAFTQPKKVGIDANVQIDPSSTLEEECYVGAFTYIGKSVKLGKGVKIYPNCFIDDHVTIGDNTILYSGVRIYKDCHIGADCVFHSGVVIGADGFGFAPSDSSYLKIPQIGNVIIKDRVELGANTTIDRATMGSTLLEEGVKLDNLVQVAHNVTIGKNTVIAAQTGIAGSTKIGAYCMIGGQVAIIGHITIGDGVKIGAKSAVNKPIPNEMIVQGIPALPIREFQVNTILATRKLKQLFEDVEVLKGKQN